MKFKRGQVTIFIIIAIVIVVGTLLVYVFKDSLFPATSPYPADIESVVTSFQHCIEEKATTGVDLLESQGGYIYLPQFEAGSTYSPFSSQLIFAGTSIPYWYYVSGNNLQKEQVPTKKEMQEQLNEFIANKIYTCNFDEFYEEGYVIAMGDEPEVNTIIGEDSLDVKVNFDINIQGPESNAVVSDYSANVKTQLGNLYDSAMEVYNYEQENLFLENYAVDTLRNYAPVDGVDFQCSPEVWNAEDIFDELEEAIEANTVALRGENNDFDLSVEEHKYFVVDIPVKESVYFVNSRNWPNSFEVNPSDGAILMAKPVGNQEGMGILGFCYVPYHFVYSMKYPVLVQIASGDLGEGEIFQFPLAVVIEKNMPREPYEGVDVVSNEIKDFCNYKNTKMTIGVYDINSNHVDADISYSCAGTTCDIGTTKNGILEAEFPQCANGYVIARADGYEDYRGTASTTDEGAYDVFMTPQYDQEVELKVDGKDYSGEAIITFLNLESGVSKTVLYPSLNDINLSAGQYEIQVYIYRNSSITIPETTSEQCVDAPRSGIGGLFGLTEEKCYDITIPAQEITNSLYGGGKQNYYILDDELRNSRKIEINAGTLSVPKTVEELQMNYILSGEMGLEVNFK